MEYFPSAESQVAVLFEVLRHRHNVRHAEPHLVVGDVAPGGVGSPTGEEGGPAGPTERHLGVGVGQDQATAGQLVQAGSFHLGRTEVVVLTKHTNVRSNNISTSEKFVTKIKIEKNSNLFQPCLGRLGIPPTQKFIFLFYQELPKIICNYQNYIFLFAETRNYLESQNNGPANHFCLGF